MLNHVALTMSYSRARRFPLSDGPGQVKLPVGQVDLNRFFLFISYEQIEEFQNSWSRASDDFEKRQALYKLRFLAWLMFLVLWPCSLRLQNPKSSDSSKTKRKFSSFFKSLVIELDKDLYGPDNHLVEVRAHISSVTLREFKKKNWTNTLPADLQTLFSFYINSLRAWQNGCHFADDTFKSIFLTENFIVVIKISLKFVLKGPINNIPALVQIMACRRPGNKPLSEPMMIRLSMYICVIRPQWVKLLMQCIPSMTWHRCQFHPKSSQ